MAPPEATALLAGDQPESQTAGEQGVQDIESVYDTCSVVGAWRDLLLRNIADALDHFTPSVDETLPIRQLFKPAPSVAASPVVRPGGQSEASNFCCPAHEHRFKPGDAVYAKVEGQEERWYLAAVESVKENGTYEIRWNSGAAEDTIKDFQDLAPAGHRDSISGRQCVLNRSHAIRGSRVRALCSFLLAAASILALHGWASILMRNPCPDEKQQDIDDTQGFDDLACSFSGVLHLQGGGAVVLGGVCVALCLASYLLWQPIYKFAHWISASAARQTRRFIVTACLDPLILHGLPTVFGLSETIAVISYVGLVLAFAVLALVTADAGTIAFGSLAASRLCTAFEIAAGESAGDLELQKRKIFIIAEELRQKIQADITADELRWHLVRFLELPAKAESVELPLPVITVLRSGIRGIEPDSIRLRHFILLDAHAELEERNATPYVKKRRDLIVDVFKRVCAVPGVELAREKWHMGGCKYPWHLGIKDHVVSNILEPQLREVGLGEGFYSYEPDGAGSWVGNEAPHMEALLRRTTETVNKMDELSQDLHSLLDKAYDIPERQKVKAVKALAKAGADVNYAPEVLNGFTPLHAAIEKRMLGVAKLLIDSGADPEIIYTTNYGTERTPFEMFKSPEDWEAATSHLARHISGKEGMKWRLGADLPENPAGFSPDDVVEVTAGGGRGELVLVIDEPERGVFRVGGHFPVKHRSELQAVGSGLDLDGFCITRWTWPQGDAKWMDPVGVYVRASEVEADFGGKRIYRNRPGKMVLYEGTGGHWQIRLYADSAMSKMLGSYHGPPPADGVKWDGGIAFSALATSVGASKGERK